MLAAPSLRRLVVTVGMRHTRRGVAQALAPSGSGRFAATAIATSTPTTASAAAPVRTRSFSTSGAPNHDAVNDLVAVCPGLAGPGDDACVTFVDEVRQIDGVGYADTAQIIGTTMQVLRLRVPPGVGVRSEPHSMLWSDPGMRLNTTLGEGFLAGVERFLSGGSVFLTEYTNDDGDGSTAAITLGAGYPSRIVPFDLRAHGGQLIACKGSFLAGPLGTAIEAAVPGSLLASVFGGAGLLLQRVSADDVVFLHAGGTVARRELRDGEVLRVNPGCLLAFASAAAPDDATDEERQNANLDMFRIERVQGISNMLLGQSLFVGSIRGPGTVWLQSLPWSRVEGDIVHKASSRSTHTHWGGGNSSSVSASSSSSSSQSNS